MIVLDTYSVFVFFFKCTGKQEQLANKMKELTIEIRRIKSQGEGKALADTQEQLAETREIKDKAQHDLDKAKKVGLYNFCS
jgi:hypothetical protein